MVLALAAASVGHASAARAQAQDKLTLQARERFLEGVDAYDKGNYEDARIAFLQAYALKRHPAVLLNLGQSELKAGNVEEGGNHLHQFLRDHDAATADQRRAAQEGISEARKKAAFVIFIIDTDGATVGIDGQVIGTSPLGDPVFLRPGEHEASAALNGKVEKTRFTATKGSGAAVTLNLRTGESSVAKVAPPPAPTPTPTPTPSPAPSGVPGGVPGWDTRPPTPYGAPRMLLPPDVPQEEMQGFGDWFKDSTPAWGLAGFGGVGLILTVAGIGVTANADGAVDSVTAQILDHAKQAGDLEGTAYEDHPCGPKDDASEAHPNYVQPCRQLSDNLAALSTGQAVMVTGLVLTLASGGALAGYYFYDRGPESSARSKSSWSPRVSAAPVISPGFQGVSLVGSF